MFLKNKLLFLVILTGHLFANNNCTVESVKTCDLPEKPSQPAYNASARIEVCDTWDLYTTASFIYWETRQHGVELGYQIPTDRTQAAEAITMDFDYDPGFKIGIGYKLDRDGWIAFANYIRFHSSAKKDFIRPNTSNAIRAIWWPSSLADANNTEVQGVWKVNLDVLNLTFQRPEYRGLYLIFKPFYGLKGGWLDQRYKSTVVINSSNTQESFYSSKSWLVGRYVSR